MIGERALWLLRENLRLCREGRDELRADNERLRALLSRASSWVQVNCSYPHGFDSMLKENDLAIRKARAELKGEGGKVSE